ncbi:MAG: glycosyl transferase family protein [Rhodospirillaceae bacterium]|jgi:anthranilate phosphoribosyltransferase|nr:glycosyl transferase family protein [Rhodospirillaceae bacterium]
MDREEHPFAQYVRIIGRGKNVGRSLTMDEAEAAMDMILAGEVRPEQLGAFLMLLRVKEETPEEVAGFVKAARKGFDIPADAPKVDLDWSSYAGKRRQLPWFLLAALALAQQGVKIFMHGAEGHTPGRLYTRETLEALSLPVASDFAEAAQQIKTANFAYLPLSVVSAKMHEIIELRPILGLRSPVHTISRMLNPFGAPNVLQGIFHPGYNAIHQGAAQLLGYERMAVFRGEGGEIERRPSKPLDVWTVENGEMGTFEWPALLPEPQQPKDDEMEIDRLVDVWKGDESDAYAIAAVTGTLALALHLMGRATDPADAQAQAEALWAERNREKLAA